MREAAVVSEAESGPIETAEYIKVGRLGRQRERQRCESSLAIQPSAPQTSAGQKVRDRFQSLNFIL